MDSRKLAHFVEAIEQGSLNRAAAALRISQPALSKAIRLLELELGVELMERTSNGVRPTNYGKALYSHAKAIMSELVHAREEIRMLQNNESRRIVIGSLSSFSGAIIVPAIERLLAAGQAAPLLRIVEKPELELIPDLRRGAFDFVLGPLRGGDSSDGLTERPLFSEQRKVVARADHPLARLDKVTLKDVGGYPWILPPVGAMHRGPIEQLFRSAGLALPEAVIEGTSMHFLRLLLLSGDYLVSMSEHSVVSELQSGQLRILPIELPTLSRTIGVIHRAHRPIPAAARGLLRQMETVCRGFIASSRSRPGARGRQPVRH